VTNDSSVAAGFWQRLSRDLLLDRSVLLAVGARVWQFLAGGVSLVIVARYFSPEVQGFYYAFVQILAIQTFFDLGLTGVLIYVASHEWGANDKATAETARKRLGELILRSRRWYLLCSTGFAVIAAGVGFAFFQDADTGEIAWLAPWLMAVVATSGSLWLSPSLGILEGCGFVTEVNAARFVQAMLGNLVVWAVIIGGGDLWAVVASTSVRLAVEVYLVAVRFRPFFADAVAAGRQGPPSLSWGEELLPLQWRIAAQSVAAYIVMQAYTPIVFKFHGPVLGGQMGMTWSALSTLQLVALAWLQTRVPQIGRSIAQRQFDSALKLFWSVVRLALGVYVVGGIVFLGLVTLLDIYVPWLSERLLGLREIFLFEVALGVTLLVSVLGVYVRAHKIDPFLRIGLINAAITGALVWWLAATVGPAGAALAHIVTTLVIMLPVVVVIFRRTVARDRALESAADSIMDAAGRHP